MKMNLAELEIHEAIRQAQRDPTIIRYVCIICKDYLSDWDIRKGKAVCWKCSEIYFPAPKVEAKNQEPKKAQLFQLKDGKFAIIVE